MPQAEIYICFRALYKEKSMNYIYFTGVFGFEYLLVNLLFIYLD
jgi:hypothetical protein